MKECKSWRRKLKLASTEPPTHSMTKILACWPPHLKLPCVAWSLPAWVVFSMLARLGGAQDVVFSLVHMIRANIALFITR